MYRGRYEGKHRKAAAPEHGKALRTGRLTTMVIATVLLLALAIGGTLAWLSTKDAPIQNTFLPTKVTCEVTETFDRSTGVKSNVNVKNTGTIDAFIRVKLVTYRTNDEGQHIGGTADGNQAEQNQLRRVQRVADGCGHGRACDCRCIAARRDQKRKPQLLAQRLDDRADQQAGEQTLRHRAHGVDAVAVRRDDDVLAFEK